MKLRLVALLGTAIIARAVAGGVPAGSLGERTRRRDRRAPQAAGRRPSAAAGRSRERHARARRQDDACSPVPRHPAVRPGQQGRPGSRYRARQSRGLAFVGPTAENSVQGQIEFMTNAPTQDMKVVMLSNNAGDQIAPARRGRAGRPARRS